MVNDDNKLNLNGKIAGEHSENHKNFIGAIKIQLRTFEKLLMQGKLIAKVGVVTIEFNLCYLRNEKFKST